MAEAFLNILAPDRFYAESAGMEPGELNPLTVEVMREIQIDITNNITKSVFDKYKQGELFHYVITVCDQSSAEICPIFPGLRTKTLHWSFEDPTKFVGSEKDKLQRMRSLRDQIKNKILEFITETA